MSRYIVLFFLFIATDALAQPAVFTGERCRYMLEESSVITLNQGLELRRHPRAAYRDHAVRRLVERSRSGLNMDAHSRALLRLDPSAKLTAKVADSTYFSRSGVPLIQMIYQGRVRRSHLIPDSLFMVPEDRYTHGLAVAMDLITGRLPEYHSISSRIVGVFRLRAEERDLVVVVLAHDHLRIAGATLENISIAIYSAGLMFLDLIRVDLKGFGPVPIGSTLQTLYWSRDGTSLFGLTIRRADSMGCDRAAGA